MSLSSDSQRNQTDFKAADLSSRNFNSAKARLNNRPIQSSDRGPIFVKDDNMEPTRMSAAQLERIKKAVKKKKDVFKADVSSKKVRVASYVLGKNERHKNPQKLRATPNIPKPDNKSKTLPQSKSQPRDLSLPRQGSHVRFSLDPSQQMLSQTQSAQSLVAKQYVIFPKKVTAMSATPAQKAFQNLKKVTNLPNALRPPMNQSLSNPNLTQDSRDSTLMLPRIVSTNTSNADLQGIGVQKSNLPVVSIEPETPKLAPDQAEKSPLGVAKRKKSSTKVASSKSLSKQLMPFGEMELPEGYQTIDFEFFKQNKVKKFNDVHHVEKVLEKAFPSANKEEKELEKMAKAQTFLYEAYLDVDNTATDNAQKETSQEKDQQDKAIRQNTFGGNQLASQGDSNETIPVYETPLAQFKRVLRTQQTPSVVMSPDERLQPWTTKMEVPNTDLVQFESRQPPFADVVQSMTTSQSKPNLKHSANKPPTSTSVPYRIKDSHYVSSSDFHSRKLASGSKPRIPQTQSSLNLTSTSFANYLNPSLQVSSESNKNIEILQAFLTEHSSEILQDRTNPSFMKANKLIQILNNNNDQRSSSVPRGSLTTKTPLLSKELKESTANVLAQTGQIAPKEFLQKIDSEIRQKSLERLESLKRTHQDGFNRLEKCGIIDSLEPKEADPSDYTGHALARRNGRQNSQFSQNVREMNFFSVFVNNTVDEKIEVQKLASEESSILPENLNRDNKETSLISFDKSQSIRDVATPSKKFFPKQDQKDEKGQDLPQKACQCHSLTNEMIRKLVLDSPIKDLVEKIHLYKQFTSNGPSLTTKKSDTKNLDPLRKALEQQAAQNSNHTINERTDVSVLNILLNQILTGKYSYDLTKIDEFCKFTLTEKLDRFLKGINFKDLLSEAQQSILHKQEGVLEKVEESDDDEINLQDFFLLNDIKEKEQVLAELLETRKMPTRKFVAGEAATFLTQIYKDSDQNQKEMVEKFPNWDKSRNIMKNCREIINEHAASKDNVANQKKINDAKLKREKEVRNLFDQIKNITQEVQQTSINFFQDQTLLSPEQQANNAGKEQLLYLCFLEIVRQVSGTCKEQALFLVKLWHAYFDQYQQNMRQTLNKTAEHTNSISQLLEQMTQKFAKVLVIDESKDLEFLALIDKHDKALQLLELVSKNLYIEREHSNKLQVEFDTLKENFKDFLPNYEKYYQNQELRQRLMKYSILESTDAWELTERQQLHLTPAIKKAMEEQMERDPFQARIVQDIYRIQSVCTMRMPVDYALENAKEAFHKSSVALKMKEIYHKNLQERAQRLKRQNEELIKRLQNLKEQHDIVLIQKEHEAKERITKAVKQFRQEQLHNILSEPKEVQTDHELLERYFNDLENQRELGIRTMMAARRLTGVQMQQIRVMKAFEKQPKFKHLTKPIVHIMRTVKNDRSEYPAKTLKKTLEIIAEVIVERLALFNEPTNNFKVDYLNLDHFYAKFMQNKYGIDQLAQKYTEQWLVSIKAHSYRDYRVALFMRFLGLGGTTSLPFSVFQYYLHLVKATNVEVDHIFKKEFDEEDNITLSYQKVMFGYKGLLKETNVFNRRNIMMQMRHASKINAQNPVILRELSFSMFETYRYLVDKVIRSQKYRSFSELLNALFELHSHHMEQERKNKSPKKRRLKRGQTTIIAKTGPLDPEASPERKSEEPSTLLEPDVNFTPVKEKPLSTIMDEVANVENYMDQDAKANQKSIKVGEELQAQQPIRPADAGEDEKDFVRLDVMVKFFLTELSMTRASDETRLYDLLGVILINAQGARRDKIIRNQALRAFTEKIEIQIPLDHYFHIGINAQIDHENSENMWLEKVFNFYSQLQTDNYKAVSGMDPDHKLVFRGEHTYDGLEFVQFYIFVKDGGSKYRKDQVQIFQIYEDECSQKNRQRLSCDDFIELIRKFNLIKSKGYFENNMRLRYEQAKGRTVHVDCLNKSVQVSRNDDYMIQYQSSEAISQLTKRSKSKPERRYFSKDSSGQTTPTQIKFRDLTDLQSIEGSSEMLQQQSVPQGRKVFKRRDSFEQQFEDSKTPFKSHQTSSMLNVITPMSMAPGGDRYQTSIITPVEGSIMTNIGGLSPDIQRIPEEAEISQAKQYLLVSKGDGSLEMSDEPNLAPSMLETLPQSQASVLIKQQDQEESDMRRPELQIIMNDSAQAYELRVEEKKDTSTTTFNLKEQTHTSNSQFTRPPSPIIQTEQSRIIDQDVQETINKINMQLNQPIKSYEQVRKQALQKSGDALQNEEDVSEDVMIEQTVQSLQWNEGHSRSRSQVEQIGLSRTDTLKAHAIENVNLVGYSKPETDKPKVVDAEDLDDQVLRQQPPMIKKDSMDSELGYLNLMFGSGPNNQKLQEMTEEAIHYVEKEMKKKGSMYRQNTEESKQKGSSAAASQPRVTEANSQSEFTVSLGISAQDETKIQILLEGENDEELMDDAQPATAGLPPIKDRRLYLHNQNSSPFVKNAGLQTTKVKTMAIDTKEFHHGMGSGLSEWNKGAMTEMSIAEKSMQPSKYSDKTLDRSQTMNNYMEVESKRSSKRTMEENKSLSKKPKKVVKKKKKKGVKMIKSTQSMIVRHQKTPSKNEDISGIMATAEGDVPLEAKELSLVELRSAEMQSRETEEQKHRSKSPVTDCYTSARNRRNSYIENRSLDRDSSPVVSRKHGDSSILLRSRSSPSKSVRELLDQSASRTALDPYNLEGGKQSPAQQNFQSLTPGFAMAGGQFKATPVEESPDKDIILFEDTSKLHPDDFNYGNYVPNADKSDEEIKDEKKLKQEIKMLEKREMEAYMQKNKTGFFADHKYDDDDDFFAGEDNFSKRSGESGGFL